MYASDAIAAYNKRLVGALKDITDRERFSDMPVARTALAISNELETEAK